MYKSRRPFFWVVKKKMPIFTITLFAIFAIFVAGFIIVEKSLQSTIKSYAEARARQIATDAINDVINEKIVPNVEYQDLVKIHKDGNSRVTIVQPNIVKINHIEAQAATEINKTLKNLGRGSFKIPLGQALGSQLLASYGPKIKVSFVPIGTVKIDRVDKLDEAGINQTRHMMYFKVTSTVQVVIPMETSKVKVNSEVMIADNIILGEVPNTYVKLNMEDPGQFKDLLDQQSNSDK